MSSTEMIQRNMQSPPLLFSMPKESVHMCLLLDVLDRCFPIFCEAQQLYSIYSQYCRRKNEPHQSGHQ